MASPLQKYLSTRGALLDIKGETQRQAQSATTHKQVTQQKLNAPTQRQMQRREAIKARGTLEWNKAKNDPVKQQKIIRHMATLAHRDGDMEQVQRLHAFEQSSQDEKDFQMAANTQLHQDAGSRGFEAQGASASLPREVQIAKLYADPNTDPKVIETLDRLMFNDPTLKEQVAAVEQKAEAAVRGKATGDIAASKRVGTDQWGEQRDRDLEERRLGAEKEALGVKQAEDRRMKRDRDRTRINTLSLGVESARDVLDTSESTTGASGFLGNWIPGSKGKSQVGILDELKSKIAKDAMQDLKRLSATGSTGFGQLSEKELKLLERSIAEMDPHADHETFMRGAKKVFNHYQRALKYAEYAYSEPPLIVKGKHYTEPEMRAFSEEIHRKAIDAGFTTNADIMDILVSEGAFINKGGNQWELNFK